MVEWSRRWTRDPLESPRPGSNPADNGCTSMNVFHSRDQPRHVRSMGKLHEFSANLDKNIRIGGTIFKPRLFLDDVQASNRVNMKGVETCVVMC